MQMQINNGGQAQTMAGDHKQWQASTNGCECEQERVGAVTTTAAAAPSADTNESGGVQTMEGEHKQLRI